MLEYDQALTLIKANIPAPRREFCPLGEGLQRILAGDLFARVPLPSFDNAAVDGYAVALHKRPGIEGPLQFRVMGEIRAGSISRGALKPGEAAKIFTGAPVPKGADAVIMQEQTQQLQNTVTIEIFPALSENIRFRGEDIQKGNLLLQKGTHLSAVHLAVAASSGFARLPLIARTQVAVLTTGSELIRPGGRLKSGKIFDSNSILLEGLVQEAGASPKSLGTTPDRPAEILKQIRKGLKSDVLLIAGGVSVGDYDFVKALLKKEGGAEIFWKVNIKPGKPLFFGRKGKTLVFGLPGNPVSVFITFQEFVRPVLLAMGGRESKKQLCEGRLTQDYQNGSRRHFVRALCSENHQGYEITPLKGQGSHMLGSLAKANAILDLAPEACLKKGERVHVEKIGGMA